MAHGNEGHTTRKKKTRDRTKRKTYTSDGGRKANSPINTDKQIARTSGMYGIPCSMCATDVLVRLTGAKTMHNNY